MQTSTRQVTPEHLRDLMPEKHRHQKETYVHFYNKFKRLAVESAKQGEDRQALEITAFDELGLPFYEPKEIYARLIKELEEEGFWITHADPEQRYLEAAWIEPKITSAGHSAESASRQPPSAGYNFHYVQEGLGQSYAQYQQDWSAYQPQDWEQSQEK